MQMAAGGKHDGANRMRRYSRGKVPVPSIYHSHTLNVMHCPCNSIVQSRAHINDAPHRDISSLIYEGRVVSIYFFNLDVRYMLHYSVHFPMDYPALNALCILKEYYSNMCDAGKYFSSSRPENRAFEIQLGWV